MKSGVATSRATASLLLLVMFVPAIGPLAMAGLAPTEGMHCMRRRLLDAAAAAPAMHCHQGASHAESASAQNSASPESAAVPEASFRSLDCCCNHCNYGCCCRIPKISGWANPVTSHLSFVSPLVELTLPSPFTDRVSAVLIGPDSARAPPRR
jgi:hypothetical protein